LIHHCREQGQAASGVTQVWRIHLVDVAAVGCNNLLTRIDHDSAHSEVAELRMDVQGAGNYAPAAHNDREEVHLHIQWEVVVVVEAVYKTDFHTAQEEAPRKEVDVEEEYVSLGFLLHYHCQCSDGVGMK